MQKPATEGRWRDSADRGQRMKAAIEIWSFPHCGFDRTE